MMEENCAGEQTLSEESTEDRILSAFRPHGWVLGAVVIRVQFISISTEYTANMME
jgi:hypothetical protein